MRGGEEAVRLPINRGTAQSGGPGGTGRGRVDSTSPRLAAAGEAHVQMHKHEPVLGQRRPSAERCVRRRMARISTTGFTELVLFEVGLEKNMSLQEQEEGSGSSGRGWRRGGDGGGCRSKDTDLGKERVWVHNGTVTV